MAPELLIERLHVAAAIALLMIGAVTAWTSGNVAKRLAGLVIAQLGALLALAALGAPVVFLLAGIAVSLVMLAIGAALMVRLQEAYGGVEASEFDAADEQSEPAEPAA
ncbi:MAG: hypothetical protein WDM79_13360 [Terricaulis sp.]